ncbi:MAG: hypothetical protein ACLSCV_11060 [Acutalibacteraceae bacterium]
MFGNFCPLIARYDPNAVVGPSYAKPSAEFLLGTNDVGMIFSANWCMGTIFFIGWLTSAAIAAGIGIVVGVLSGWFGGMIDSILMKITSFFITIPYLPLVIVLTAFLPKGFISMSLILGLVSLAGNCPYLTFTNHEDAQQRIYFIHSGNGG